MDITRFLARLGERAGCETSRDNWPVTAVTRLVETDPRSEHPHRSRRKSCGSLGRRRLDPGLPPLERAGNSQVGFHRFFEKGGGFMDQSTQWRENKSWYLFDFRASQLKTTHRLARCRLAGRKMVEEDNAAPDSTYQGWDILEGTMAGIPRLIGKAKLRPNDSISLPRSLIRPFRSEREHGALKTIQSKDPLALHTSIRPPGS